MRFCCQIDETPCDGKWTEWLDFDQPDGFGDFETIDLIQSKNPSAVICPKPLAVSVKTDDNKRPTGLKLHISKMYGVTCLNKINVCPNLEVRFCCPTENRTYYLLAVDGVKSIEVELRAIQLLLKQRYESLDNISVDFLIEYADRVKVFNFYDINDLIVGLEIIIDSVEHTNDSKCNSSLIRTVVGSNIRKYDKMIIISGKM